MGKVSLDEARELIAKHEVDVIDIRDEEEWVKAHIPGAHRAGDDVEAAVDGLDSDRTLLIVCADGKRSAEVADELDSGDREASSLEGGMSAWQSEGLRIQPTEDYSPGPAPIEEGDDEMAAEIAEGTMEPDEEPKDPQASDAEDDDEDSAEDAEERAEDDDEDSAEDAEERAEDDAGEPVEAASGDESPQQDRS